MSTWRFTAKGLVLAALGMGGCQYVAGLDEDRSTTQTLPNTKGTGGAGGEGGAGGAANTSPYNQGRPCSIETTKQASQQARGNAALAFVGGQYQLVWPYFANGVAANTVGADGIPSGADDILLVPEEADLQNAGVAAVPFGDSLVVALNRQDANAQNAPTLVTVDPATGKQIDKGTAKAFQADGLPEVLSLATTDDLGHVLMVLHALGTKGPTHVARFNGSLTALEAVTVENTLDAAAAYSKELDTFGLFFVEPGAPNRLVLRTLDPDAMDLGTITATLTSNSEAPGFGSFAHSVTAAAAGGDFFVAWTDQRVTNSQGVYLARVDGNGKRLGEAVLVSEAHPDVGVGEPNLIFDGKQLVIVYRTEQKLYMRRFATDLTPIRKEQELGWLNDAGTERAALAASEPGMYGVAYPDPQGGGYFVFQRVVCDDPW